MAKLVPYDVEGVEEGGGGTGVKVKPGVHVAEIVRCQKRDQKKSGDPANDIEVALSFGDEFDWAFTYIGLSKAADWKLAEFVRALGLKEKGNLDPDKMVGKLMRVKVNSGSYEGEYAPDVGRLMPAQKGDKVGEKASELSSTPSGPDMEPEEEGDGDGATEPADGFVPSRESDPDIGSYDEWTDDDLVAEADDRGVALAGGRGKKRDKAIAALRADDEAADGDGGDGGGGDDDTPAAEGDEYDDMDLDALKAEWDAREMGDHPNIKGRNAADRLKAAIIEALREDDTANPFEA